MMTDTSVIADSTPLQEEYVPPRVVNREEEQEVLSEVLSTFTETGSEHLVVEGPRGTGKSHLVLNQLRELPDTVETCYVNCHQYDTQYKVLSQVYRSLFGEPVKDGLHTATLQRELERRAQRETVLVLDELDFILLNDGDNLLYYLTRGCPEPWTLVLIAANHADLADRLEERTYSSLHPRQLHFEPYTDDELFDILANRARKALKTQSLHQQALDYIASRISHPGIGLHWLKTAGEATADAITQNVVERVQSHAYQRYVDARIEDFSDHHRLLFQAIEDLTIAQETSVQSGPIYTRYQRRCELSEVEPLSRRRISDFLKHLELLNLITVDYHYGGERGRTREIQLHGPLPGEKE